MALFCRRSTGFMPISASKLSVGVVRRHSVTLRSALLMGLSIKQVRMLRHHPGAQYSAVESTNVKVVVHRFFFSSPPA